MKKQLVIVGIIVLLVNVGFSGCLETNKNNNEPNKEEQQSGTGFEWFQTGNMLPITQFETKQSRELMDNHIGGVWWDFSPQQDYRNWTSTEILDMGLKRGRLSFNEIEWNVVNWSESEFYFDPACNEHIKDLTDNGITITYVLSFWDKANHPQGWGEISSRFKTEEEIQRYLEFVKFIVHYFKNQVHYFEIWNEPDNNGFPVQYIESEDYVNLVKRVAAVIRQEDLRAKIVVGSTSGLLYSHQYFFSLLNSEIMPLVDVIAWHPMYGTSPAYEELKQYYYEYPSIIQQIKNISYSHGFRGEYRVDELTWYSPDCFWISSDEPWVYTDSICAKYYSRGIIMHLGIDVDVTYGGMSIYRPVAFPTVRNLCTIMSGTKAINLQIEIQSDATLLRNYNFSLSNGDKLIAIYTDSIVIDNDTGVMVNLTIHNITSKNIKGIDVLEGFQQSIVAQNENGNLTIQNLIVKDYPLILKISE